MGSVRTHAKLDHVELVGRALYGSDLASGFVYDWEKQGYLVKDTTRLWRKHKKPWGLSIHRSDMDFRAFPPFPDGSGYLRRVKLTISGAGYNRGVGERLVRDLFDPIVEPDSVEVFALHVAVDVELPFLSLLVFRDDGQQSDKHDRIFSQGRVTTEYVAWSDRVIKAYCKDRWLEDAFALPRKAKRPWFADYYPLSAVPGMEHTRGWRCCTRFEVEFRLNRFDYWPKVPERVSKAALPILALRRNPFAQLRVIDLREVPITDPWRPFMVLAKLLSIERVCEGALGADPDLVSAFRSRLRAAGRASVVPHPAEVFVQSRTNLQGELDALLGAQRI